MGASSLTADSFAKTRGAGTCTALTAIGTVNFAIARKIREIYASKTAEILASWLKIAVRTAKHRLAGSREFTLDELETLLHSEHGFKILSAIMERAKNPPSWWRVCEPLMDLADAELLIAAIRERTRAANHTREVTDALETELRRAQAVAIHGPGPARAQADALQHIAGNHGRMVAPPKGRRR